MVYNRVQVGRVRKRLGTDLNSRPPLARGPGEPTKRKVEGRTEGAGKIPPSRRPKAGKKKKKGYPGQGNDSCLL